MRETTITYTSADSTLVFDRTFSGRRRDVIDSRKCRTDLQDGILKLCIILDLYSAEVFVNDGRQVLSSVIYTDHPPVRCHFLPKVLP
jgi:beta-fructofuranosidase